MHYTYKNKYNKKIDRLSAKNKKKLDYKQLRLSDNYLYSSEEEQEEEQEKQEKQEEKQEKQEEQKKQDKKPFDPDKVIEWMTNKERASIHNELFKKPIVMYKVLYETNNKEKNSKLVNIFNSGLKDLEKEI